VSTTVAGGGGTRGGPGDAWPPADRHLQGAYETRVQALRRRRRDDHLARLYDVAVVLVSVLIALASVTLVHALVFGIPAPAPAPRQTTVPLSSLAPSVDPAPPASPAPAPLVWRPVGRSVLGRPILAATFGSGVRRILVIGGVHGSEYGADVAERFAEHLAAHPEGVPQGTQVDVIACLNPDGRVLGRRGNARLVDLNRNMPSSGWVRMMWRGDSAGPWPASEPETRVLLAYLRRGYIRVFSLHSSGGLIDYDGPGAWRVAWRVGGAAHMPVQHLADSYAYSGTLGQFVPERYGVPVITVELQSRRLTAEILAGLLAGIR
jgi:murein peptide amidase A